MANNQFQSRKPFFEPIKIIMIGGHKRSMRRLADRCRIEGWKVENHSGETYGRNGEELRSQIGRSDIVAITTRVNSHGGMFIANDLARRLGRTVVVIRRDNFEDLRAALIRCGAGKPQKKDPSWN